MKYWFYLSYFLKAWAVFRGGRVGRSIRMMEKFERMIEHLGYTVLLTMGNFLEENWLVGVSVSLHNKTLVMNLDFSRVNFPSQKVIFSFSAASAVRGSLHV